MLQPRVGGGATSGASSIRTIAGKGRAWRPFPSSDARFAAGFYFGGFGTRQVTVAVLPEVSVAVTRASPPLVTWAATAELGPPIVVLTGAFPSAAWVYLIVSPLLNGDPLGRPIPLTRITMFDCAVTVSVAVSR